jgi:alcohol dehydrogenase
MLADLMEAGRIKSVIERIYPLSEAGDAMNYLSQGHSSGKVIIKIV